MLFKLFHTREDLLLTLLRLVLGVVMFAHGAQKLLGWWGGQGYSATMEAFTGPMGIPSIFAMLAIIAEFAGGLGLVVGLFTRIAAFGIASVMAVAIATVHGPNGLFMSNNGFEYNLLAIAVAIVLMVRGAGAWSLDRLIEKGLGAAHLVDYRRPVPHHG